MEVHRSTEWLLPPEMVCGVEGRRNFVLLEKVMRDNRPEIEGGSLVRGILEGAVIVGSLQYPEVCLVDF